MDLYILCRFGVGRGGRVRWVGRRDELGFLVYVCVYIYVYRIYRCRVSFF